MNLIAGVAREELQSHERQILRRAAVNGKEDVSDLQSGGGCGGVRLDVGNDHAVSAWEFEGGGERRRDGLNADTDFGFVQMAKAAELMVGHVDDAGGNGEAQAFVAAGLRKNEGVDAYDFAVDVDQRAA